MNAAEIIKALGGRNGMCRCPAHDDRTPSLSIAEAENGKVLLKCFAGCSQDEVMDALTRRGLWGASGNGSRLEPLLPPPLYLNGTLTSDLPDGTALNIWRGTHLIDGTPGETYFRNRGITGPIPVSLKYAPALYYYPINAYLPAVVAAVSAPNRNIIAIQQTFLTADGTRKVPGTRPRFNEGSLKNGAVRLAKAETSLGIAEGIEDALSAMQLFDIPCWAALGTSQLPNVWIPPGVIELQIFGDNDAPGREAADKAAEVFSRMGKRVALRFPPSRFKDWNDAAQAIAQHEGIREVSARTYCQRVGRHECFRRNRKYTG